MLKSYWLVISEISGNNIHTIEEMPRLYGAMLAKTTGDQITVVKW